LIETREGIEGELVLRFPKNAFPGDESTSQIRGRRVLIGFECWFIFGKEIDSVGWLRLKNEAPPKPELV